MTFYLVEIEALLVKILSYLFFKAFARQNRYVPTYRMNTNINFPP